MDRHLKILAAALSILWFGLGSGPAFAKEMTWGKITAASQRFQALANFGNAAVLDRETGLVWEQCPSTDETTSWHGAKKACFNKELGGRMGWRLPTYEEMASLGDPNANPFLPNSGAFCSTASAPCVIGGPPGCLIGPAYWTATIDPDPGQGFVLGIMGSGGPGVGFNPMTGHAQIWCVRGGQYSEPPTPPAPSN